jgi:hypothetical protein
MESTPIGISKLKAMTYRDLRELHETLLVEEFSGKPVGVVLPYVEYLKMQGLIIKLDQLLNDPNSGAINRLKQIMDERNV